MTAKTKKEQTAKEENTCPICICDFEAGDNVVVLRKCSHYFHKECLRDWLLRSNLTCPLCRNDIELP